MLRFNVVRLKHKLKASAPSLTPWQLLDQFGRIQMVEVWFKLRAGGCVCLERVIQPEAAQAALIHQLNWPLSATTCKRRSNFPTCQNERKIPGNNPRHYPDRLPLCELFGTTFCSIFWELDELTKR
jgi:hypothetical protein